MGNFLKSLVIGTATGVATAYFLTSEKGKEVKVRVEKAIDAYKENPDDYHQMAKEKGFEYSNLAKETFNDYKHKFESGELTKEQVMDMVKEKTNQFVHKTSQQFSEMTSDEKDEATDTVPADEEDIIIDITKDKASEEISNETLVEDDILASDNEEALMTSEEVVEKVDLESEAMKEE